MLRMKIAKKLNNIEGKYSIGGGGKASALLNVLQHRLCKTWALPVVQNGITMFDIDERYVESTAYHEAGHIVVAAVQGLRLRRRGLRIDRLGAGLASYCDKKADGSKDLGPDSLARAEHNRNECGIHCPEQVLPELRNLRCLLRHGPHKCTVGRDVLGSKCLVRGETRIVETFRATCRDALGSHRGTGEGTVGERLAPSSAS